MELRPEPLPAPADWQTATSRAEALFGIRANPYLTAAGVAEFTESLRGHLDTVADAAAVLVVRVEQAYRHLGLAADGPGRLATARAGAALVESLRRASSRVHLVETLAQADLPATDTAVANSLSRAQAVATRRSMRSGGTGSLRCEPPRARADERGRTAASTLRTLREAVAADEFATRLGPVLSRTDDAIFDWLSAGQPARRWNLPRPAARTTCPSRYRRRPCTAGPARQRGRRAARPARCSNR